MSDIFREVDEEIRQENYAKLWKRYGSYAIGLAVVLVAAVAGYQIWQSYDLQRRTELSDRFAAVTAQAVEDQDDSAQAVLAEIADPSDKGYGTLAAFSRAQSLAGAGNIAEATAIWDEIAEQSPSGDSFRAIATLLSVMHQMDRGDPAALQARLQPLLETGQPFRTSAQELDALLAIKQGDDDRARARLEAIGQDIFAPPAARERAAQLISTLGAGD